MAHVTFENDAHKNLSFQEIFSLPEYKGKVLTLLRTLTIKDDHKIDLTMEAYQERSMEDDTIYADIIVYDHKTRNIWNPDALYLDTDTKPNDLIQKIEDVLKEIDKHGLPQEVSGESINFERKNTDKVYTMEFGLFSARLHIHYINEIDLSSELHTEDSVSIRINNKTPETILKEILQKIREFNDHDTIQSDDDFAKNFITSPYGKAALALIEEIIRDNMKNRQTDAVYWNFMDIIDEADQDS